MSFKLGIFESIPDSFLKNLQEVVETVDLVGKEVYLIENEVDEMDGVLIKSTIRVNEDFLNVYKNLRVVIRAGTGLDNIDLDLLARRGVRLISAPAANAESTAEFVLLQILCLTRNMFQAIESVRSRNFNRDVLMGVDLQTQTIGIIGFGNVGQILARKLNLFGVNVLCSDHDLSKREVAEKCGATFYEQLGDLLELSDVISLNASLNEFSRDLLGPGEFAQMKRGVKIVNSARASLINNRALLEALECGIVASCAVDVLDPEPPFYNPLEMTQYAHTLLDHPAVFVTPHIGASTEQAQNKIGREIVAALTAYLGKQSK